MRHDDPFATPTATPRMTTAHLLACALAFLLIPTLAIADTLSITLPASVQEGDPVMASVTGPGTLTILIDDLAVASGTGTLTHTLPTDHTSAGVRTYRFTTTDSGTPNETRIVGIADVPLALTVTSPTQTDFSIGSVPWSVTTNWPAELCYVTVSGDTRTLTPITPTTFGATIAIPDGVHVTTTKCKLGAELPSVTRTLHVDTTAPVVLASGPSGPQVGAYATLSVSTDEIALCRYGTQDAAYADLPASMGSTYATGNQVTLQIAQSGPQTFFIRCADVFGNEMPVSRVVSFTAQRPPTASITVEGSEPLRAGTYRITLRVDQPLRDLPTLSYQYPSGGDTMIGLTEVDDGTAWDGYLTIAENRPDATVLFAYAGTGLDGTVGTEILSGGVLDIDTLPPSAIDSISVANTSRGILLTWHSPDEQEEDLEYRIYRADHEGVGYVDEIGSTGGTSYADPATGARYYWYRVAAVDAAGNVGPLSDEILGTAIDPVLAQSGLDALTLARVDEAILDLQGVLTTANASISMLEAEANPYKSAIIADMELLDRARVARSGIEDAQRSLIDTRAHATTQEEADAAIADARAVMQEARPALVRRIEIDQQTETRQIVDAQELERLIPYAIAALGSGSDGSAIKDAAIDLQDRATIDLDATSFSLWDWDNVEHPYTFVRKRIALQDPANDVIIIESIPKSVAQDAGEISFSAPPTVLEQDPVVAWSHPILQEETITYVIARKIPLDEVKRTRTVLYPRTQGAQTTAVDAAGQGITGFAIDDLGLPGTDSLLLTLGAVLLVALGAYYVTLGSEPKPLRGLPSQLPPSPRSRAYRSVPTIRPASRRDPPRADPVDLRIIRTPSRSAPNVVVRQEAPSSPTTPDALLARADTAIDERSYALATQTYLQAVNLLKEDPSSAAKLRPQAEMTYAKLTLHRRLDDASAAIANGDAARARVALEQAHTAATRVGEQPTTLIKEATAAYRDLMRRLNRLEIEHAARY